MKNCIILFDGDCNLCTASIRFLKQKDKKLLFSFLPLQSEEGKKTLQKYFLSTEALTSIVYIEKNKCFLKSTAVLKILNRLGGFWKLFFVFILIPKPLRDFIYMLIAKNRKNISCQIKKASLL